MRKALGISADYEEGSHWRKQEERLRESLTKRGEEEEEELRREKARENDRDRKDDSD